MQVSRSSYYEYLSKDKKSLKDQELEGAIITAFHRHKRRYGTRRLVAELADEGIKVGRTKISRILNKYSLKAIQAKSYVPKTTRTHPHLRRSPNLLLIIGLPSGCNEIWVGDITYLPLANGGWLYLAVWLDIYSRYIVGWSIRSDMSEELILEAFEKGVYTRKPSAGLILHSDGGGQYGSGKFRNRLTKLRYRQSMTRKDNHYDNAFAESLFSRFKAELIQKGTFISLEDAQTECFDYIEAYYNTIRRHSSIGYKSPLQFEKENGR